MYTEPLSPHAHLAAELPDGAGQGQAGASLDLLDFLLQAKKAKQGVVHILVRVRLMLRSRVV